MINALPAKKIHEWNDLWIWNTQYYTHILRPDIPEQEGPSINEWQLMSAVHGDRNPLPKRVFVGSIAQFICLLNQSIPQYQILDTFLEFFRSTSYFDKWAQAYCISYHIKSHTEFCEFVNWCLSQWTQTSDYDYAKYNGLDYNGYTYVYRSPFARRWMKNGPDEKLKRKSYLDSLFALMQSKT